MNTKHRHSKRALVLAGGGISGAVYEIGALRAIDDLLASNTVNDFDIYVGTSAGSLISACLANGVTTRELLRMMEGALPHATRLGRNQILAPNVRGVLQRGRRLPTIWFQRTLDALRNPTRVAPLDWMWNMMEALPTGIYSSHQLEKYLANFLRSRGANSFERLSRELYIIATALDTGDRAVFGAGSLRSVPISQAVAASSAMPIVYQPVRINGVDYIDGGVRGTASLDIAIEQGARLIVCINPLVPFDNSDHKLGQPIADQGLQAIGNQVFRTFIHAGLHYHLKKLRHNHADVDIILIEPRQDDALVFADHVMRFSTRLQLARHGYESATLRLADQYDYYKSVLSRHGIRISRRRVAAELARLLESDNLDQVQRLLEGSLRPTPLTRAGKSWRTAQLANVLGDLEDSLNDLADEE